MFILLFLNIDQYFYIYFTIANPAPVFYNKIKYRSVIVYSLLYGLVVKEHTMDQAENKMEPIQAVERAMQILEIISKNGSMSLNDLYKELGVGKASILRLTYTLVQKGYLDKDPVTGNYNLTLKTYQVGSGALHNLNRISLINASLTELNQKTGRIAQFSVEDDGLLLCLQSVGSQSAFLSAYTGSGYRSPLYCTGAGKALLSTYTNDHIIESWPALNIKSFTENTITDVHTFLQAIAEIRRQNYALDMEEYEYGVFCVGTVLMGNVNQPLGAVSLSGSSLTPEEEQEIARILVPEVKRLSRMLGYIADSHL